MKQNEIQDDSKLLETIKTSAAKAKESWDTCSKAALDAAKSSGKSIIDFKCQQNLYNW